MTGTSGLVSAYQVFDCSAQRVQQHNLAATGAEKVDVRLISVPEMLKLREMEFVKIRVPSEHEQIAFALLVKRTSVQVLPGPIFGVKRGDFRILQEAGVPYEVIE